MAAPNRGAPGAKPALPFLVPMPGPSSSSQTVAPLRRAEAPGLIAAVAAEGERQDRRQRRQAYAASLLDRLDRLAIGLAGGRVESAMLEGVAGALAEAAEASEDPSLEKLVEAIELRATVEMAKIAARSARFREAGEG